MTNLLALQSSQRVRAAIARERATLLDHRVSFLLEDPWRSPWSTDTLRPTYPGRPYPVGKQAWAWAEDSTGSALDESLTALEDSHCATQRRVATEVRNAACDAERRLRAAQKPLAVIEPQSSLPSVTACVEELEKRCRLPIEEIRGCFRQGRRSAEQKAIRAVVEDAIRAMVKHHRTVHPVFDRPELGMGQWKQARATWREFIGQDRVTQNNRQILFDHFGGDVEDETGSKTPPSAFHLDDVADSQGNRPGGRRSARTQRKPQIVPRLAEALGIYQQRIREVLARSGAGRDGDYRDSFCPKEAS